MAKINELLKLNQIYLEQSGDESSSYDHWKIRDDEFIPTHNRWLSEVLPPHDDVTRVDRSNYLILKQIGRGVYEPTETQIRNYNLLRKCFVLDFLGSVAYLTTIPVLKSERAIYTDETINLGRQLLILKQLLGIESDEVYFEIVQNHNSQIVLKSQPLSNSLLQLDISQHRYLFRYQLNRDRHLVLLYPVKYNEEILFNFKSKDLSLKQLTTGIITNCILNFSAISPRTFWQQTSHSNLVLS